MLFRTWKGSEEASGKLPSGRVHAIGSERTTYGYFSRAYIVDRGPAGSVDVMGASRLRNGAPVVYLDEKEQYA